MSETLLLNPRRRRKAARRRSNPSAKQKANWARFARMARAKANPRRRARRRNPATVSQMPQVNPHRRRARRRNPAPLRAYRAASRRRSNPIGGLPSINSIIGQIKEGAVMGAGAVGIDVLYGYLSRYLPANMQATGGLNLGAAAKAVITVALGALLSKPTRGMSRKAALGSLIVQSRDVFANLLPAGLPLAGRMGYYGPAMIRQGTPRIGLPRTSMGAYIPGAPSTLNRYTPSGLPGASPLLSQSGRMSARAREGQIR